MTVDAPNEPEAGGQKRPAWDDLDDQPEQIKPVSNADADTGVLEPDLIQLETFARVMFKNARRDGFVSFRVFEDNGKSERPVLIQALRLDDHEFAPLMLIKAENAANWFRPAVFAPPVCTFKANRGAKADDILEGVALTVECDQNPIAASAALEALLGPATVVVESGGECINSQTGEIENKAHLHWRLKRPAATPEELAMLYELRSLAATLVGGDRTAISIVHPLRWPGSWHRKKTPKLCRIIALNEDVEIDLEFAWNALRKAVGITEPAPRPAPNGSGQREATDLPALASALAAIPNDSDLRDAKGYVVHGWHYWNWTLMTIWAASGGSEEGRLAAHQWSAKAKKYDKDTTEKRWKHYFKSPPTRLSFGSLVYRARQADPNWGRADARAEFEEEIAWNKEHGNHNDTASKTTEVVLDPSDPMPSAVSLVRQMFTGKEGRTLQRHREAFWQYDGACYRLTTNETIGGEIWNFLDRAKRHTEKGGLVRFKPSRNKVADVHAALAAACLIDNRLDPPGWLSRTNMPPPDEFFACGNGLLHVPTGKLYPPTSDYFGVAASEVCFDPNADRPAQWLAYLDQVLGDKEAIETLQEYLGYCLTPDTSQQKILFLEGPRRSGKGTWARITTALLGKLSVAGPTMAQLGETFGLEPLITKPLAIVSDARIGGRTDKSVIVERLLSISGEDTLTVNRKHVAAWTGRLSTRFVIMTNELPALTEGSGALVGRFLVLIFVQSFFGREDISLTAKLRTELPGILNWAIAGHRRLRERGHFVQPKNALAKLEQIEMLAAPVKAFLRDCCVIGPGLETDVDQLFQAWRTWSTANGGPVSGSKEWFGRNLHSAIPGLDVQRRGAGGKESVYVGLVLTPDVLR